MKKIFLLRVSNYSYLLMMLFLPISLVLDNIFLAVLFLSSLFSSKKKSTNIIIYGLIVFVIFIFVNGLLKSNFNSEQEYYIRLIPLLIIPFSITNIDQQVRIKGLFFLIIGILVIQLNSVYGIINYYHFTEGKKYALKNYSKINEILGYERPYLGFFSALSIVVSYYLISLKKIRNTGVIITLFSLGLIITISARLAIIIVFLSTIIIGLKSFNLKNVLLVLLVLFAIISIVLVSNSSLKGRFNSINHDARLVTWSGAIKSFKNNKNYIFGYGSAKKTRINLLEHYKNYENFKSIDEKNRFVTKNYNTHNQYLNELLRGGVVGFLLFLAPQIVLLYYSFKTENTSAILFMVSIICFCFVENILDRQLGVYLYGILLSFSNILIRVNE